MRLAPHFGPGWFLAGLCVLTLPTLAPAQDAAAKPAEAPKQAPPAPAATATDKPADAPAAKPALSSALEPAPRPGNWVKQHEKFLERAGKGPADLLFLGDSITAGWNSARGVWDRSYGPRQAVNFGIGGDRTQHVLWRLDNGEVDSIKPKVVVLMIGTNNLGANTEPEIAEGVKAIVDRLRSKLPEAKVLLLGIFPRHTTTDKVVPTIAPDPRIARINARLAALDDGKTVKYLDIGVHFLDENGQISRTNMPDFLHLTPAAYQIWADVMEPTLWKLMDDKAGSPAS